MGCAHSQIPGQSSELEELGRSLGHFVAGRTRRRRWRNGGGDDGEEGCRGLESNKSWLLADVSAAADPQLQSVHSSFRFSFGSQAEAEGSTAAGAAAVLLLVSVEGKGEGNEAEVLQCRMLESLERSISPVSASLVRYSYSEIRAATCEFSKGRELGRGPLSRVFKGRIGLGRRAVAIKRVEGRNRESRKAFCRELMIAGPMHHPNVVPLLGFCVDPQGLFLVYKYISGGSLDQHLHHDKEDSKNWRRKKVLPWGVRYKVAMGVAQAVEHLHYGTDKCVIHRDIKPSNILLSSRKTPRLCDFGLATWLDGASLPFLCKSVKGTFGYLAPEYFQHGKLSDKTDIYALGVVFLELITGRKAIDQTKPQGDENLVLWAKPHLEQGAKAMGKLIDPRLKPSLRCWNQMNQVLHAATACLSSEESTRPSIDRVIGILQGNETINDWSVFMNSGCLPSYGSHPHDSSERSDMKGHLALAMLGVSDSEEDNRYGR